MTTTQNLPLWDMSSLFPSFGSKEHIAAKQKLEELFVKCNKHFEKMEVIDCYTCSIIEDFKKDLLEAINYSNDIGSILETLNAYAYACYSVNTKDPVPMAELNATENLMLEAKKLDVIFKNILAKNKDLVLELCKTDKDISFYKFYIDEQLLFQTKQMKPELEELASDLCRSGGDAWSRLQEVISSNTCALWDEKTGETKTVVELRNFAYNENREIRQKAYEKELAAWKSVELPIAASLNGVKGFSISLNKKRGWGESLNKSIAQARISKKTLDALLETLVEALPMWRKYMNNKAKLLGIKKLAFFDIFAPVGKQNKIYSWEEASSLVIEKFNNFSPDMGAFARDAINKNWIDAQPRSGKVGGAYCISFPSAKQSRVMCNFDGSFSSVSTVAHELGHAYHGYVLKDEVYAYQNYPMTLAETASIFAETIIFEDAVAKADKKERLSLLEIHLQDGCQVLVDILCRYYFEKAVFEQRENAELSAEQLCSIMIDCQKKTYGDGLDSNFLHPYMWAAKSHYYSPSLAFYNFPYAFGQLFGLGLYAKYQEEGPSFAKTYKDILFETTRASAVEVCAKAGFDIEKKDFWESGIRVFENQANEFDKLVNEKK